MSARGRTLSVFFALLLLAGLATGIREIYYLVFVLGLLLLITLTAALGGVFSLRASQSLPDELTIRGEGAAIRVRLFGWVLLPVTAEVRLIVPGPPVPGGKRQISRGVGMPDPLAAEAGQTPLHHGFMRSPRFVGDRDQRPLCAGCAGPFPSSCSAFGHILGQGDPDRVSAAV